MDLKKLVGRRVVVLGPKLLDQAHLETVTLLGGEPDVKQPIAQAIVLERLELVENWEKHNRRQARQQ